MTVETAAVMSGHKRKLGEGKLFWLTAYLQLGNYILNTLNLSDIYNMLYETSQPQVIRNPSVQHLSVLLPFPSLPPASVQHFLSVTIMQHQEGRAQPFRRTVNRSG